MKALLLIFLLVACGTDEAEYSAPEPTPAPVATETPEPVEIDEPEEMAEVEPTATPVAIAPTSSVWHQSSAPAPAPSRPVICKAYNPYGQCFAWGYP